MLRKMATSDLSESSFAGVTSQVQTYGWIGMCNAADISDMSINGYLSHPTNKKDLKEGNRGMFNDFPEELQLTDIMASMEDAPITHQANNQSPELQRERRREKYLGLENTQDD